MEKDKLLAIIAEAASEGQPVEKTAAAKDDAKKVAADKLAAELETARDVGRHLAMGFLEQVSKVAAMVVEAKGDQASYVAQHDDHSAENSKGTGGHGSQLYAEAQQIGTTKKLPADEAATKALKEDHAMGDRKGKVKDSENTKASNPTSGAKLNLGAGASKKATN